MNSTFCAIVLANMWQKNMVIIAMVQASCDTCALNTIEHWNLFMLLCHACNLVEMKPSRARFKKLVQLGKTSTAVQCVQLCSHRRYLLTYCVLHFVPLSPCLCSLVCACVCISPVICAAHPAVIHRYAQCLQSIAVAKHDFCCDCFWLPYLWTVSE